MEEREAQAQDIVKRHALIASGLGLIPIPLVDLAAITATQLKLVKDLSEHYEIEFSSQRGKSLIGALIGASVPGLAAGTTRSLLKMIPGVGGLIGMVTVPILAGASTYAVGRVFIQHFEAGGTLLDFDPAKMKAFFAEQFEKGKTVVSENQESEAGATTEKKVARGKPSPRTA